MTKKSEEPKSMPDRIIPSRASCDLRDLLRVDAAAVSDEWIMEFAAARIRRLTFATKQLQCEIDRLILRHD